jgi:hypothetical protein
MEGPLSGPTRVQKAYHLCGLVGSTQSSEKTADQSSAMSTTVILFHIGAIKLHCHTRRPEAHHSIRVIPNGWTPGSRPPGRRAKRTGERTKRGDDLSSGAHNRN